jgi:LysR family D-serine deaminase transcriptional activator
MGDLALKLTIKYAMGQINSSFCGKTGVIFIINSHCICQERVMDVLKTLGTRLLNGWQLSKLSTFEVAARHESFALAADELSLTQRREPPD